MILNMYLNECSDSTMLVESLEVNSALNNINNILLSEADDHVKDIKTKLLKLIEKLKNALKALWKKIKKMIQSLFGKLKKKKVDDKSQMTFEFRSRYLVTNPIRVFKNALNLLRELSKYRWVSYEDRIEVKYMLEKINKNGVYERLECSKNARDYNINVRDLNPDNVMEVTGEYDNIICNIDATYDKVKGSIEIADEDTKYIITNCNIILNIISKINSICTSTIQEYTVALSVALSKVEKK